MIPMRAAVLLVGAVLVAGAFAGCFGAEEEPATPASVDPGTPNTPGTGTTPVVKVLAALDVGAKLATDETWVQSGTEVPVTVKAPANAKGEVTYTYAVGPLPGTVKVDAVKADTGAIEPGASKSLTFAAAGSYLMHCHPHPFMKHNVTVVAGLVGPKTVHVQIVDGKSLDTYRFVPENIAIGAGTTVVYHNNGTQVHTTTLESQDAPLKAVTPNGNAVKVEGEGWQRVVVIATDSEGRFGQAEVPVYVTSELPTFETATFTGTFKVGGVEQAEPAKTFTLALAHGGKVFMNWTAADAGGSVAADANLAKAEVHLAKQGETQDTLTGQSGTGGNEEGVATPGTYVLRIVPQQGAEMTVTVSIDVIYDLVPPEPKMQAAGGDDHGDHGGHGGHGGH